MKPIIVSAFQIIISLGLLNVWLLRFKKVTAFRGGNASTLKEEFSVYGLPSWLYSVVGGLKIGIAVFLLIGFWKPVVVLPAAALLCILMAGAIMMHMKVSDPLKKSIPAVSVLTMSLILCLFAR